MIGGSSALVRRLEDPIRRFVLATYTEVYLLVSDSENQVLEQFVRSSSSSNNSTVIQFQGWF